MVRGLSTDREQPRTGSAGFPRPVLGEFPDDAGFRSSDIVKWEPRVERSMSATCIRVNVLCTGCMGPTSRVVDHGDVLSAIASLIDSIEKEIARLGGRRPVGTLIGAHCAPQTRGDPQEPPAYRTLGAQR